MKKFKCYVCGVDIGENEYCSWEEHPESGEIRVVHPEPCGDCDWHFDVVDGLICGGGQLGWLKVMLDSKGCELN
jgi:hypothetical protein